MEKVYGRVVCLEKDLEEAAFRIIASAGEARGQAYDALDAYEGGEFDKVDECLKKSGELIVEANKALFKLIQREARGEKVAFSLLLVHACDILMVSTAERDLIKRVVKLVRLSNKGKEDI